MSDSSSELKKILTPVMVWGLGVGYVISGNYFGWNLGLVEAGSLGLAIATGAAIILFISFTYSYAELACAIPKAGGAFDYANRGLGAQMGFVAGMAQNIEFIFAPPAIALAIGSYMNLFFSSVPVPVFSVGAYLIFTAINIYGVKTAARVELLITGIAVLGLLMFALVSFPSIRLENLQLDPLPNGLRGIFAAAPFAIWFFLGIEGVANLAEEAVDPRKTMSRGFLLTLFTLIIVCMLTFSASVGVGGWKKIVYLSDGSISDSPLPLAIQQVTGVESNWYVLLVVAGLFGLAASFNGLMLAAGRSTFEFGKQMLQSAFLGKVHPAFRTPVNALLINMAIGIMALATGRTAELITLSVLGALSLYCISMISLMNLRRREPLLDRPFQTPFYPWLPITAMVISGIALLSVAIYNPELTGIYAMIIGVSYGIFRLRSLKKAKTST